MARLFPPGMSPGGRWPVQSGSGQTPNATVRGQFSRSGYDFMVQGDAEVQRLLEVARTIGLPAPQPAASGEARINLRVGGGWAGFAAPQSPGTAQLHSVRARVRGLSEPVEISSATHRTDCPHRRSSEADCFRRRQHLARLADHSQAVRHSRTLAPIRVRSSRRRICDR